jgi:lipoic acid synthetase
MPKKFPEWIRAGWGSGEDFQFTRELVKEKSLHTVCQSANCPNIQDCWSRRTATMMVLGNTCSRSCRYCSVPGGKPETVDADEPHHVGEAVLAMGVKHIVITSVTRDDLPDGGAGHIAATIQAIKSIAPGTTVEVLVPDFEGSVDAIRIVMDAKPEVFSHNIETVERLYPTIRSRRYDYRLALGVLRDAASMGGAIIKSSMMIGHGETADEVEQTMRDLRAAGVEAFSAGQYLRPTRKQREVEEFVHPDQFQAYEDQAYALGFAFAVAGPFVRSSYRSEELLKTDFARRKLGLKAENAA